jgi:branched-chain amino acid transport system permease protein
VFYSKAASAFILTLLAVVPLALFYGGQPFWLDVATRLVILAIAAASLNFILGYGGLVSFGHAAYLGLGAYAVGIPVHHSIFGGLDFLGLATTNGWVHLIIGLVVCALFALLTGAVSLRTKGVYFIMITMAFSQMLYYALISIKTYGGDDGLTIMSRSELPGISLDDPVQLYALCFVSLLGVMALIRMLVNSRFGQVLQGARGNAQRVQILGFNIFQYQLFAYVLAGVIAGYAGFLLANFTAYISPEMMDWTRSGELMFMVILGGVAVMLGPVLGAAAFILVEELFSHFTIYWQLPFGLMLMLVVLYSKGGLAQWLRLQPNAGGQGKP